MAGLLTVEGDSEGGMGRRAGGGGTRGSGGCPPDSTAAAGQLRYLTALRQDPDLPSAEAGAPT